MELHHPITVADNYDYTGYQATDDNGGEPGFPAALGATPLEAVQNLLEQCDLEPYPATFIEERKGQYLVHHYTGTYEQGGVYPTGTYATAKEAKARVLELIS